MISWITFSVAILFVFVFDFIASMNYPPIYVPRILIATDKATSFLCNAVSTKEDLLGSVVRKPISA